MTMKLIVSFILLFVAIYSFFVGKELTGWGFLIMSNLFLLQDKLDDLRDRR